MPDDERRPDPEELLRLAQQEERLAGRGRLKVFVGAVPGVGKTYAMLEAARARRAEGVEVVAGLVETHGRPETAALLAGLELLPRASVPHRDLVLAELDLDAALARHPALLLVDELAHTNAPGCRHTKRWQDVEELLAAGVSVYTTLNVQHLESLNDVVWRITDVRVRETIPDHVLEQADELELVDLPPDELLQRLKEGKVYVADQAERAVQHFFRKGNLIALRELALRATAQRVDAQMLGYRLEHGIGRPWPVAERVLVGVGPSPSSASLLRAAHRLAAGLKAELLAVTVETAGPVTGEDGLRVARHLLLAERLGAKIVRLSGQRVSEELLRHARAHNVTRIVVGKPTHPRWRDRLWGSLVNEIIRGSGEIDVHVIRCEAEPAPGTEPVAPPSEARPIAYGAWLAAPGVAAAVTALGLLGRSYVTMADVVMLFVLAIMLFALRAGTGPAVLASALSVLALDFFFVPPYFTLAIADFRYVITFAVLLAVALVTSSLTIRLRRQAAVARESEQRTATLHALARELAGARGMPALAAIAVRHLQDALASRATLLLRGADGALALAGGPALEEHDAGVAAWVADRGQPAGAGTQTLAGARCLILPLKASRGTVGVLALGAEPRLRFTDPLQRQLAESFADLVALAIERALLVEEAQAAQLAVEAERLRNAILSSVSHDLRTPLAAILGPASALAGEGPSLDPAARQELASTLYEEAEKLDRLVGNLLEMTRIEAGAVVVRKEWQPPEEVVGAALERMSRPLAGRPVTVELPADLPLVPLDPVLLQEVLVNLLDNALKYSPAGSPIDVRGRSVAGGVELEVADRGPGVPEGERERIFDKFRQVRTRRSGGAAGLGLAICRALVGAHGGAIRAGDREGGGACFRVFLPVEGEPPRLEPEREEEPGAGAGAQAGGRP